MKDCLFCKIAAGEMDTNFIYQDEKVVVFEDINPKAPVHLLIVPKKHIADLNIKTSSKDALVKSLSGGNQQKVVIAKLLYTDVDILLFDEPTRGIDVGAKREIYKLMDALTEEGKSIIMISSELPEVLGMSDRVLVMNEGHLANIYDNTELSQEEIMKSATKEVK